MKNDLRNKIIDIARTKKDGVYTKEGWHYFVKGGEVGYFGNSFKGIYISMGYFISPIWEYDFKLDRYENQKKYDKAIKELKRKEFKCQN